MNCDAVECENIVERYLSGALGPDLQEQWEEHYFACDRCAEQLETWSLIEKPLRAMETAIRAEIQPPGMQSRSVQPAHRSQTWL